MKELITEELIDIFDRIGIQTPENFDEIIDFIHSYLEKSKDEVEQSSVSFGFKLWIESKV